MSYVVLSPWDLTVAATLMILPALISLALKLGVARTLAWATVRAAAQLAFVGLVLRQVFAMDRWYLLVPVLLVMAGAAAHAAIARTERRVPGARLAAFVGLVLATSLVVFTATEVVLDIEDWTSPQYVIPLFGMLLGNSLTGVSLSVDRLLGDLTARRDTVEAKLVLGMPLWQATLPWLREAVRTGMVPTINTMMVVGIVSLPGMMTGQILAGADPLHAAGYQLMILFMIVSATALTTLLLCLWTWKRLADPMHRVRWADVHTDGA